ncbi:MULTISPECIES: magnesium-translocating P-type ATPase [unclassified Spirosoma]|uniref:magnesium-translocating P-type ATPase n=1 Tax=unclassified Spirosoma TaxID=2621999 RepID=UPI0009667038|nr:MULTISPECIES: magnesium-translocating P-type ATPase [unclassified Spirosoma]MBN8823332.1 magnesium-translocating P-type ATPase [Spirosoma sp.]OJW72528.1 MAG: magnesium-translocating P-type ATPase [Spirosoma sp. 48-14]
MNTANQTDTFWTQTIPYWAQQLGSSENGLTEQVAQQRLKTTTGKQPESTLQKDIRLFIAQFKSPLMLLLIGAVLLSAFLGDTSDVMIILFILLSTGLISFFQERNAGQVVEKLQALITIKSTVIRDGQEKEVPASQLVPGDVLLFNAGDMVPADCLLIETNELQANEASLTGESFPVRKEPCISEAGASLSQRPNCLWEGSNIVSGSGKALVIHTGQHTVFGNVVQSASSVVETSFDKGLKDFGFMLMRITLALSAFILVINLINQKSLIESALFALALAVGMAPELLPAITTIAMSAGAKRLLDKKVIVKKLNSIQNLGEISLLCTDKTGTITEGAIQINGLVDAWGQSSDFVKTMVYYNALFETGYSNPIDEAIRSLTFDTPVAKPTKLGEIPYDFTRKRLSIAIDTGTEKRLISKGAFTECLSICSAVRMPDGTTNPIATYRQAIEKQFEQFGQNGMRALAVCYKDSQHETFSKADEVDMTFAGFVLMKDPIKAGVVEAIGALKQLNIDFKIISGDNRIVAQAIGRQIGIDNPVVMTGKELLTIDATTLPQKVKSAHIFSEVEPQQKEHIIQALRQAYTVAYMGDGINDVPAINAADVGITVDNATDVARDAADFILLEKDLSVIADGISEGRKTFSNTLKYIYISTGSTFGNMCSVALASLFLPFLPMLPKQILLTNFLTDFPFLSIPSDNVDQEQIARPGKWNIQLIKRYMLVFGIHSSLFDVITFSTLLFGFHLKESGFQSGWFIESILTELLIFFIIRTRKNFFRSRPARWISLLSLLCILLTVYLPYSPVSATFGLTPPPVHQLAAILLIILGYVLTADLLKVWFFRRYKTE